MSPRDIVIDAYGRCYVVDTGRGEILVFERSGAEGGSAFRPESPDGEPVMPMRVSLDARGELVVTGHPIVPGSDRRDPTDEAPPHGRPIRLVSGGGPTRVPPAPPRPGRREISPPKSGPEVRDRGLEGRTARSRARLTVF